MKALGLKISLYDIFLSLLSELIVVLGPLLILSTRKTEPTWKPHHKIVNHAVIGLVDIVSSVTISNSVDILIDFQLKHDFQQAAAKRAAATNIQILNDTGDGFLFLANPTGGSEWCADLAAFYEGLTADFKILIDNLNRNSGLELTSGLRFGVTYGSVILGGIGNNPRQISAVGPDVNLAARLCARAGADEIVFSARAWEVVESVIPKWNGQRRNYNDIKGFAGVVPAIHASGRLVTTQVESVTKQISL